MLGKLDVTATSSRRRVLIVDDDAEFAESLGAVLEEAGHEVRLASSASETLNFLTAFRPDVAIADLHMPVVDGYALLAIFRADPDLGECTFVGISGDALEVTRAAEAFDHFFIKPLEMSRLVEALEYGGHSRRLN